jgi:type I site-specific restriction-modification system R (restriction) subunit
VNASFGHSTGAPARQADANTCGAFPDYFSIYNILRTVEDGANGPIHREARLAKLHRPTEIWRG